MASLVHRLLQIRRLGSGRRKTPSTPQVILIYPRGNWLSNKCRPRYAGLVLTETLLLPSAGVTSFTGFTILDALFSGTGPFAAGIGMDIGEFTPGTSLALNGIIGNAYNLRVPALQPPPVQGAFLWAEGGPVDQAQDSTSNEAIWLRPLPLASCRACSLRRTRS